MVGRERELAAVDEFLVGLVADTRALILAGEAGIGKTTVWSAAIERAEERGYRVLACRPAEAEARLSYAAVCDLLAPLDEADFQCLPQPQRRSVDAALLRADLGGARVDQRAVSAGVASLLRVLASKLPVVVAVDDAQWLDPSSARVLGYAVRRLRSSPVGILVSVRDDGNGIDPLELERAFPGELVFRSPLAPLSLGALRQIVTTRVGSISRPLLLRIARVSAGNPFYALELAESLAEDAAPTLPDAVLSERLKQMVAARIEKLPRRTKEALFLAAALRRPTVSAIELAGVSRRSLEAAEAGGVLQIRDGEVRFVHPLLASAACGLATSGQRSRMHRRLAAVVLEPEERARHLALATDRPDAGTAAVVERAAGRARERGAPDAAAELLEQALRLTPASHSRARRRRMLAAAEDYFYGGDRGRARSLLEGLLGELGPSLMRSDVLFLLGELRFYDDSWPAAVPLLEEALACAGSDPERRGRIALAQCYVSFNLGDPVAAAAGVALLREEAESAANSGLLAQALGARVAMDMSFGRPVDQEMVERALALEDWEQRTMLPLRPTWLVAQALLYTGEIARARSLYATLRRELTARGLESDLPAAAWLTTLAECLAGDFQSAREIADEAVAASLELESRTTRVLALSASACVSAYLGWVEAARETGEEAMGLAQEIGWTFAWTITPPVLGFLALSAGDAAETHRLLSPLADQVEAMGLGEPMLALFLPDEIEALIALGELEQARRLLLALERQGRKLDRAWALATGSRCRGLLLAAEGDLPGGEEAISEALVHHARLNMPFELARTLLVRGQIQRRSRRKSAAKESLEHARRIFEELGTPLWSATASAEIARVGMRRPSQPTTGSDLTETEQRVAALAASGLTNREIAARLFVSPKTVQANLAKVYEKLGVHSRAQLGARAADLELLQR
jgi:DNA-binding CsgD family transcriptional regulator